MEPVLDETRTLRRTMRDLVALSALPAVWAGYWPLQVAEGLADVLLSTLRLVLVYIRLPGQTEGQEIEVARTAGGSTPTDQTRDIGRAFAPWLDGAGIDSVPPLPNPVGPGTVRVVVVPIGCGRQDGVLVAGSQQTAFPSEEARLLLRVAANQAAAAIQQQRAEAALRESEERYRSVIAAMQEGVVLMCANGCIRACNASAERILGLSAEQIMGRTPLDPRWRAIHEDGSAFPGETHPVMVTLRTGRPCSNVVMGVRKPNGELTWVSINSQPLLRGNEPSPYAVVASFSDVTERKNTEEALRESEHRWRSLTEALPQLVWTAAPDGSCDYFSTQWTQYTGIPESELLGWRWLETLHPDDREPTRQFWTDSVAGRGPYDVEYRVHGRDGVYRWFKTRGVPIRDSEGHIFKWFGTCTDISDHRQTEEALRESEERFRGTFENAAVGIAHVDAAGRFLRVNEKLCDIVGYTREELLAKTFQDITYSDDLEADLEQFMRLVRGDVPSLSRDKRYVRKDGSPVWVAVSVSLQRDAADRPLNTISVVRDITERKRLEKELRHAKDVAEAANRAKDEFLANVSHEIRTPMNAILGMTELALDTPLTDDQRQCLKTVKSAADNLLGIINDLLDFSKIEAGKLELAPADFSLRTAIGDTLRALAVRAHKKGLELIYHVEPDVPDALIGDAGRLRQVLLNLVGNAIKFTEQGEVVIHVSRQKAEGGRQPKVGQEATAALGTSGPDCLLPTAYCLLRFTVSDTGIGIPQDKQESIFRAFEQEDTSTTRKYGGTGLGLTIASRLVALMGGQITVDSSPGRGSTFAFTARFGLQPHLPEPAAAQAPVLLHDLPVLIVDDNATNRHILEGWLRGWQMKPAAAGDGLAALDALWHGAACGRPYALVLLDARMPDMDGLALAAQIRQRGELAPTRIILLTSGDRPGDLARSRELRVDAHLLKPVQQDELMETIYRVMSRPATVGSGPWAVGSEKTRTEPLGGDLSTEYSSLPTVLRILVAEDNEFNAQLLEQLLGRRGHHVRVASNGREALALLGVRAQKAEGRRQKAGASDDHALSPLTSDLRPLTADFDLLFLDVHMPELDGFQVVQAVRERERAVGGHLPIIALTARSRKEDREQCLAAGMDDFLAKPIQAADLWAAIDRVVGACSRHTPCAVADDGTRSVPATGVLDPRVLLAACGDDQVILEKICQAFRARLPDQLAAVQEALRKGDAPRLREAAHKLSGMVAAFSTVAGGVASDLEDHAARCQLEEARALVERLETMAQELMHLAGDLALETLRQQAEAVGEVTRTANC